jgi:hypothetical protein
MNTFLKVKKLKLTLGRIPQAPQGTQAGRTCPAACTADWGPPWQRTAAAAER